MSAFRFGLQPLLELREKHEDEQRGRLTTAARAAARARERSRSARDDFARAGRDFTAAALRLSPQALREALVALEFLERSARSADASAREHAEREDVARGAFVAARAERRRIEALRDRAQAAHTERADRRETLAVEDANAAKHNADTLFASSFHN